MGYKKKRVPGLVPERFLRFRKNSEILPYKNLKINQLKGYKNEKSISSEMLFAVWTGLEPATSCVTGRHSNQLNYQTVAISGCKYNTDFFICKYIVANLCIYFSTDQIGCQNFVIPLVNVYRHIINFIL